MHRIKRRHKSLEVLQLLYQLDCTENLSPKSKEEKNQEMDRSLTENTTNIWVL